MTPWQAWRLWRLWSRLKQIPEDQVMLDKLKSRKLWAMVLAAVLNVLNSALGLLDDAALASLNQLIMLYIGGQAVVDTAAAIKPGIK